MRTDTKQGRGRRAAGFTLIEVLIVIAIVSLMMVWLIPNLLSGRTQGEIQETQARLQQLASAVESYQNQRRFGDYPPDNFRDPARKFRVSADSINPGIESLVAFLSREDSRDRGLNDLQDAFVNTDNDKSDGPIGKLDRPDKVEIADAWGNPIVYFHKRSYKEGTQTYRSLDEDIEVHAWKRPDGSFYNPRSFQLFSAGPDQEYNTADDIGHNFTPEQ